MKTEFNYIGNLFIKNNGGTFEDIKEIRLIKSLKGWKIKSLKNRSAFRLLFFSNDDVTFNNNVPEDCLMFYSIKTSKGYYILGIHIVYNENGTRNEILIFNDKISSILYLFLKSKYNPIL